MAFQTIVLSESEKLATLVVSARMTLRTVSTTVRRVAALSECA
jgi:hypothetical protein